MRLGLAILAEAVLLIVGLAGMSGNGLRCDSTGTICGYPPLNPFNVLAGLLSVAAAVALVITIRRANPGVGTAELAPVRLGIGLFGLGLLFVVGGLFPVVGGIGILGLGIAFVIACLWVLVRAGWRGDPGAWIAAVPAVFVATWTLNELGRQSLCPSIPDRGTMIACLEAFGEDTGPGLSAALVVLLLVVAWLRLRRTSPDVSSARMGGR
ncbi:MAG TPA: hypothetical protein VKR30_04570 [Candidatus Limnocylindrales bacterium]|nr:hypothetical protein [Candidatus Limnocylindrales bacterium]